MTTATEQPEGTPLEELRQRIKKEVPFVGKKPLSHNIIGLTLLEIERTYSRAEANKAIEDLGLARKGFNKEPEE